MTTTVLSQLKPAADFQPKVGTVAATIANGQTVGAAVDLGGITLAGIMFPAAFTGATVGLQVSVDGVNYFQAVDSTGTALSITATAAKYTALDPKLFYGMRFIKVVSASAEGADRALTLAGRA